MGRKVSRQSCLKEVAKNEKKQLNHLIKVLRPKVYITDTSNFKTLVQQLTGNSGTSSSSSSLHPIPQPPDHHHQTVESPPEVVVHIEDHVEPQSDSGGELASSFDASVDDSLDQLFNHVNFASSFEGLLEASDNPGVQLNETIRTSMFDVSSMNQHYWDWLAYQEMESWLLDVDHHHHYLNHQEVSVYDDYQLSWPNYIN